LGAGTGLLSYKARSAANAAAEVVREEELKTEVLEKEAAKFRDKLSDLLDGVESKDFDEVLDMIQEGNHVMNALEVHGLKTEDNIPGNYRDMFEDITGGGFLGAGTWETWKKNCKPMADDESCKTRLSGDKANTAVENIRGLVGKVKGAIDPHTEVTPPPVGVDDTPSGEGLSEEPSAEPGGAHVRAGDQIHTTIEKAEVVGQQAVEMAGAAEGFAALGKKIAEQEKSSGWF